MRYLRFEPLGRDVSRLVLGTLFLSSDDLEAGCAVLDEWVALGGNAIDTSPRYGFADRYGYGDSERALGRWLATRPDVRDRLTVVSKACHPNHHRSRLTPEDLTCDLRDTTARLGGPVDLYLLHRDEPGAPVVALLEALDGHRRAGRIGAYGVSNWTPARIEEAGALARGRGLQPFCCSSPQLSLARQNEPHWPGTVSAADPADRAWYARTRMPVLAWSAQARGFFAGRLADAASADPDLVRVYLCEDNSERLRRAERLAAGQGVTANDVALAWVLHQPFPTYAVIGPRTIAELRASVRALEVELTDREVRWLDLQE